MLLMYRNAAEAEPRTKVWLDGAALFMQGGEAILVRGAVWCLGLSHGRGNPRQRPRRPRHAAPAPAVGMHLWPDECMPARLSQQHCVVVPACLLGANVCRSGCTPTTSNRATCSLASSPGG